MMFIYKPFVVAMLNIYIYILLIYYIVKIKKQQLLIKPQMKMNCLI